jgi:hypothetical protein
MPENIFRFDDSERTSVRMEVPLSEPEVDLAPQSVLLPCSDCGRPCSRYAEACPGCGRFFRGYSRTIEVIPGAGWVGKVAWGIVVSSFLWGAILIGLFMVGIFLLVAMLGAGTALTPLQR